MPSHAAPRSFEPRALQPSQRARVAAALAAVAVARRRAWISAGLGRVVAVATAAVAALAIWMLLARAGLLAASTDRAVFAALAALVVVGLVWALAHRLGWLESAQLLDGRGGGRDRLTTALDLAAGGRDDSWAAVQAAEAATLVATLDVSALVPIERPRGLAALITVTVCAGLALFMPVGGWSAAGGGGGATGLALALPEGHAGVVAAADMLSADALELMRADVALLDDVIEQLDAGETRRWLERVRTVLEDVEAGTIDRREALAQLGELEAQRPAPPEQAQAQGTETGEAGASAAQSQTPASRAEAGEDERDRDRAVKKALAKAALEGLDKAPEGQLREALKEAAKQGDLGAMAKVLEKLAEREMSDKELERWVRFAERMAKSLGDRELLKQFEKLAERIRRLEQKRSAQGGLSPGEQRRLSNTRRALDALRREHGDVQGAGRTLQRLEREARKAADELRRAQDERSRLARGRPRGAEDELRRAQQRADLRRQMGRQMRRAADEMRREQRGQAERQAGRVGDAQVRRLQEAMRQAGQRDGGRERFERQARGQQPERGDGGPSRAGAKDAPDQRTGESRREAAERAARERREREQAERQTKGETPAERALRKAAEQRAAREASAQRGERRRQGKGGKAQKTGRFRLGQGELPSDEPMKQMAEAQGGAKRGGGDGYGQGAGDDRQGERRRIAAARTERVRGKQGEGPSVKQVFVDAARRGFAKTAWRDVYADYAEVADEMLEKEGLPPGRKQMVRRYYELIRPRSTKAAE